MRFRPEGMSPNAWAIRAGVSRTVWADMRRHGNPSRRTLEKLLGVANSSLAEFEALRLGGSVVGQRYAISGFGDKGAGSWGGPQLPQLPVLATASAGEWACKAGNIGSAELREAETVDWVARPPSLASDGGAYAITIAGNSMWPRFRPGRRVAVSPKAAVGIGDDVVVKLKSDRNRGAVRILVNELVRQNAAGIELRQFNPDLTFEVPAAEIAAIDKVVGELI